ncbi:MAG: hypothetical protein ACI8PT_001677 [Gammaproteobacteria bacterium]
MLGVALTDAINTVDFGAKKDRFRFLSWAIARSDDDLRQLLLLSSNDFDPLIEVTMASWKVYIGKIVRIPAPGATDPWIEIFPLMSGYRDTETLQITITTFYIDLFELEREAVRKGETAHYQIFLAQREIHSVRP